jgi:hypothetical protein
VGRRRAVIENMAEVSFAPGTQDFNAEHAELPIFCGCYIFMSYRR